tara:strand:+ start:54 stop:1013 length:960 start_codon:yes stop_codon:yes gene_type:complete
MDEFELIKKYFKKLTLKNPGALKLNDDVFFDKNNKVVLSVDTYNEGIHYLDFKYPDLVIKKIIRSSISDLICKGVKPKYFFLSGSGNKKHFNVKNLRLISRSLSEEQRKYQIKLSGGDTVLSKKSSFTVITLGYSKKIIKRNNAKSGDDIYVTGNLGDAHIGLKILKKQLSITSNINDYFKKKYFKPDLPLNIHKYLHKFANSSIDISDGLFDDLNKLLNNQKLNYIIEASKIPKSNKLNFFLKKYKKNLLNIISKGDDYQILFTSSKNNRSFIKKLAKRINQKISLIGVITNRSKESCININNNHLKANNYKGYLHKF